MNFNIWDKHRVSICYLQLSGRMDFCPPDPGILTLWAPCAQLLTGHGIITKEVGCLQGALPLSGVCTTNHVICGEPSLALTLFLEVLV